MEEGERLFWGRLPSSHLITILKHNSSYRRKKAGGCSIVVHSRSLGAARAFPRPVGMRSVR